MNWQIVEESGLQPSCYLQAVFCSAAFLKCRNRWSSQMLDSSIQATLYSQKQQKF
jgi:hypothetical protein